MNTFAIEYITAENANMTGVMTKQQSLAYAESHGGYLQVVLSPPHWVRPDSRRECQLIELDLPPTCDVTDGGMTVIGVHKLPVISMYTELVSLECVIAQAIDQYVMDFQRSNRSQVKPYGISTLCTPSLVKESLGVIGEHLSTMELEEHGALLAKVQAMIDQLDGKARDLVLATVVTELYPDEVDAYVFGAEVIPC